MFVVVVVAGLVAWVALCVGAWRIVRSRTLRIEQGEQPKPDKVHRLQKLQVATSFGVLAMLVLAGAGAGALAGSLHHRSSTADKIGGAVAYVVAAIVAATALVVVTGLPRRALARVRDAALRQPDRRRAVLGSTLGGLCYAAVLIAGNALIPRHGTAHAVGRMIVYALALLMLGGVILPLVLVRFRSTRLTGETRAWLDALAARLGVPVRDFRVIKGRGQKIANAAQAGVLPGLRFVLLTDYLLDRLEPRQLEAVVAHELGHARRHHVLIKLAAVVGVWVVLDAVLLAVHQATGHGAALLALPLIVSFPVGILLVQGLVGVRLETAADDIAAREVGAEPLADALEAIGRLNDTKRDTSRRWSIITQHPGLQDRLDHLRASSQAPA